MSSNAPLIFTIVAVVVVVALIAGYFIMRFSRGSVKIVNLAGTAFNQGELIEGSFSLTTKKDIEAKRLIVSVVGTEVVTEYDSNSSSNNRRTRRREVYRDDRVVEDGRLYPAGHSQDYPFQLKAPVISSQEGAGSSIGQAIQTGLSMLSGRQRRLEWKIVARLDAKGVDLSDSRKININDTGML